MRNLRIKDLGPYAFKPEVIKNIEEMYNAKYLGYWCLKHSTGFYHNFPVDVFYVEKPDKEKGHTHYFALYFDNEGNLYITKGDSAFEGNIHGVILDNGEVLVSRYRHHMVSSDGFFIDGGRDYVKTNAMDRLCTLIMDAGNFVITEIDSEEEFENEC